MTEDKNSDMQWILRRFPNGKNLESSKAMFSMPTARLANRFHRQIPGYRMTALESLPNLASMLGVGGIWVKDEAQRLELNSFKVMGGAFAIFRFIQKKLGLSDDKVSYDYLVSEDCKKRLGTITFASATDGNHGRGVAWAAKKLGHDCVIYVHSETTPARINAIRSYGATVHIVAGNYDDAVRQIEVDAARNGWQIISDTSWPGYEEIPTWIMQGYNSILIEAQEQFSGQGIIKPTHVFVQAGVGALACSVIGFYHMLFGQDAPKCIVVEPDMADCLFQSALANDGKPHDITGGLHTIMAGLACGEPSPIAWNVLKDTADAFMKVPDYVAARGMRILATPLKGDPMVISGESGAVPLGALYSLLTEPGCEELTDFLGINSESQILFINTEGNTDPMAFRQIIWDGSNPVPRRYWTTR
ncbi:MAG: diaminopropionate ammonia-lyase [Sphaerochaetaceae bacterium]|nr:diaminopropionate ammonia-lyase [Sphaerochaetaceae bacterium]